MEAPIPRPVERFLLAALVLACARVRSEDPAAPSPPAASAPEAAAAAIDRGLAWLMRAQEPGGSWGGRVGRKVHNRYVGHEAPHVGITALAGSSLLQRVERPACRDAARRALRWIVEQSREDGFIAAHGSRMYSHAFATLFLARAARSDLAPEVPGSKEKLEAAVRLIVRSQNAEGGWRYLPGAADSDLSVTACQVTALREARDAGLEVPDETFRSAADYVRRSVVPMPPTQPSEHGAFSYQIPGATPQFAPRRSFALAAAGVAVLGDAGEEECAEAAAGRRYLLAHRRSPFDPATRFDYYYGHFHALRAHRSGAASDLRWREATATEILSLQASDGSWSDLVGPEYATAMATLLLQEALSPAGRSDAKRP